MEAEWLAAFLSGKSNRFDFDSLLRPICMKFLFCSSEFQFFHVYCIFQRLRISMAYSRFKTCLLLLGCFLTAGRENAPLKSISIMYKYSSIGALDLTSTATSLSAAIKALSLDFGALAKNKKSKREQFARMNSKFKSSCVTGAAL